MARRPPPEAGPDRDRRQTAVIVCLVVKKALVIVLIVLVVATGLPVMMGMSGMSGMADCDALVMGVCSSAVMAAGFAFLLMLLATRCCAPAASTRSLLHSYLLERPPRLA